MFYISVKYRKPRKAGLPGNVFYVIRDQTGERTVSAEIRSENKEILNSAKDEIVFGLKTIYCVIEHLHESHENFTLDDIMTRFRIIQSETNPYREHIIKSGNNFEVRSDIASIGFAYRDTVKMLQHAPEIPSEPSLFEFIGSLIFRYKRNSSSLSKSYQSVLNSLMRFLNGKDTDIKSVDSDFIFAYEKYLKTRVAQTTVSFYMRTLRAVINHARQTGLTEIKFDWTANVDVSVTGPDKDIKDRSLKEEIIRKISRLDLTGLKSFELVRDVFMFAFYARGMELIDVANLKKENLNGNGLEYRRRLKGKTVRVMLGEKAMGIIRKYSNKGGDYLFPILQDGHRKYVFQTKSHEFSRVLKEISRMIDSPKTITFGMNRYSWSAIVNHADIAESLI